MNPLQDMRALKEEKDKLLNFFMEKCPEVIDKCIKKQEITKSDELKLKEISHKKLKRLKLIEKKQVDLMVQHPFHFDEGEEFKLKREEE